MSDSFFSILFRQLLPQSPLILLFLIGLVCSIVFYSRCPRPASFLIIGLLILLLGFLGGTSLSAWIYVAREAQGIPLSEVSIYVNGIGFLRALLSFIGNIFILVAVFYGRKSSKSTPTL